MKTVRYRQNLPTDGELLTVEFFQDMLNHPTALTEDALHLLWSRQRFGLLPMEAAPENENQPLKFDLRIEHDQLRLSNCMAVTPGGAIIIIKAGYYPELLYSLSEHSWPEVSDVFLAADSFQRIPYGLPRLGEDKFRHPYTLPTYSLQVKRTGEINPLISPDALKIGEIVRDGKTWSMTDFQPPAVFINSSNFLTDKYYEYEKIIYQVIYPASLHLMHIGRSEERNLHFYAHLRRIGQRIRYFLSTQKFRYRQLVQYGRPSSLIGFVAGLALVIDDVLEEISTRYHPGLERFSGREEILQYFEHRSKRSTGALVSAAAFSEALGEVSALSYDPYALNHGFGVLDRFLSQANTIFQTLGEIDFLAGISDTKVFPQLQNQRNGSGGFWHEY